MTERLDEFDRASKSITQKRGQTYAAPRENFRRISAMQNIIAECPDPLARHALNEIAVKISRLIATPDHLDSWIDIAGYARCGVEVTDK